MKTVRPLLVRGNDKLSPGVFHFDLPAVQTCPGRTRLWSRLCYATRGRFPFPQVRERLTWNYAQSKRADFADRLVDEVYRKGVLLMRWHVASDVYSPAYARKVLEVIGRSPHCTFWFYTRSWRVPTIAPVLRAISSLSNVTVWYSTDAETGPPADASGGTQVAHLLTRADGTAEHADLVFLDRPLRAGSVPLPVLDRVCPVDTPAGQERGTTCATCRRCWAD